MFLSVLMKLMSFLTKRIHFFKKEKFYQPQTFEQYILVLHNVRQNKSNATECLLPESHFISLCSESQVHLGVKHQ